MSNRAVREGIVGRGRDARVKGTDALKKRQFWTRKGIVYEAMMCARADVRDLDPRERKTARQWFDYLNNV